MIRLRTLAALVAIFTAAVVVAATALLREKARDAPASAPHAAGAHDPSPTPLPVPAASDAAAEAAPAAPPKAGWSDPAPREVNAASLARAASQKAKEREAECARRPDQEAVPGCERGRETVEIDWNARRSSP